MATNTLVINTTVPFDGSTAVASVLLQANTTVAYLEILVTPAGPGLKTGRDIGNVVWNVTTTNHGAGSIEDFIHQSGREVIRVPSGDSGRGSSFVIKTPLFTAAGGLYLNIGVQAHGHEPNEDLDIDVRAIEM